MRIEPLRLRPITSKSPSEVVPDDKDTGKSFGAFLMEAIGDVNTLQHNADEAGIKLAAGRIQDVAEVVVATEKATIALQLTMQVRNKVVEAYQEVMRMQV